MTWLLSCHVNAEYGQDVLMQVSQQAISALQAVINAKGQDLIGYSSCFLPTLVRFAYQLHLVVNKGRQHLNVMPAHLVILHKPPGCVIGFFCTVLSRGDRCNSSAQVPHMLQVMPMVLSYHFSTVPIM